MSDEQFIEKYEELLDKGYCNCNEMNCLDNDVPRKILKIVKRLQLEKEDLLKERKRLCKKLEKSFSEEEYDYAVTEKIALKKENQELKKQLEKKYEKVGTLTGELLYEENTKLINQQKEFIEWLKQNIENEEYCYLSQNPSERCRKDVFEEVLSKHKEIIGVKDE